MEQLWDSGVVIVKSEPEVSEASEEVDLENLETPESSAIEQNPEIPDHINFRHFEIKSEGHASFTYNYIDTQNKPSQCTDLLEETDREISNTHSEETFCDMSMNACVSGYDMIQNNYRRLKKKKYKCDRINCDFGSNDKRRFSVHLRTHTGERSYACDLCEYLCITPTALEQHMMRHASEQWYKCNQCDFKTLNKHYIVIHVRTHSGEQPYACDICEYKCVSSSTLGHHKKTHEVVKNYSCDKCSFACARDFHLARHKKTVHSETRPYQCDECTSSWVNKGTLRRHKRTHMEIKLFQCDECSYSCVDNSYLTRHKKKRHKLATPIAAPLSFEFGPKSDFNSTTTNYNMQNLEDSEAIEATVKATSFTRTQHALK